ncbi:hypothetical protein AAE250_03820 [Bacteroides sp. GD17]|jgi:hypothetical protein|uniref:hypothetical protein n=1 Tax=Bacteroides sp. GD17 TaxID=3139826 RepID=UPI0025D96DAF|nr:hypothetical protein [uncultured Bacteroides sp.]
MKTLKKRIQQTGAGMSFALGLTLLATACTNELENTATTSENEGKKVTLHANLPQSGAQTRMNFTDEGEEGVKTTWSEGDAIMVYVMESESQSSFQGYTFTLTEGEGTIDGTFEGILPEDEAMGYLIGYPASKMPEVFTEHSPLSILGNVQDGNGDMRHLSDYNFIFTQVEDLKSKVTFITGLTLLTFDLTLPTTYNAVEDGSPIRLDIKGYFGTGGFGESESIKMLSLGLQNISIQTDRKLKAYMLTSIEMDSGDEMQITLTTDNGTIYSFTKNLAKDIKQGGVRYTATIGEDDWDNISLKTFDNKTTEASGFGTNAQGNPGDGSEANPYLITNAAELMYFVKQVNGGTKYSGEYIKLTTDIYVTADEWTPIGTSSSIYFAGNFDGDGHTIYGKLHAAKAEQNHEIYFGFFGYIKGATIQNLNMNAEVIGGATSDNYYCTGSIAGYDSSSSEVKNCHNYGKVTGGKSTAQTSWTGGIAGSCTTIANCSNHGEVTGGTGKNTSDTGGIVGGCSSSNYTITNCMNTGKITAGLTTGSSYTYTGGIAGSSYNLVGCTNYGEVTSPDTENSFSLGGIIGNLSSNRTMHTCLNVGTIKKTTASSWANAGGLAGFNSGTIYSCNTHAGTVLEADGAPTPGNPAIGINYGSTPTCEDKTHKPR